MEPASFAIAVASVSSVLQTCLHGYRALNVALASSDCSLTLNVRFRLEECRLYLWGRSRGLSQELSEITSFKVSQNPSEQAEDTGMRSQSEQRLDTRLEDVDALLEIPGLRDLVMDILGRIQDVLEKWNTTMQRYTRPTDFHSEVAATKIADASKKQKDQIKDNSKASSVGTKLRWALKDKAQLEELLNTLTALNDGLENLLPRIEKENVERGLAGEYLSTVDNETQPKQLSSTEPTTSWSTGEAKAARIIALREQNRTEDAEKSGLPISGSFWSHRRPVHDADDDGETLSKPAFAMNGDSVDYTPDSWLIPVTEFQHLTPPQLDYHHAQTIRPDFRGPENYVPLPRSFCLIAASKLAKVEKLAASSDNDGEKKTAGNDAKDAPVVVLIEWRLQKAETSRSGLGEEELRARREHIVGLLHRTATTDEDFRVLDCVGYTLSAGYTPDGHCLPLVGFVYNYPSFASPKQMPVTLRSMLDDAYHAEKNDVPDLGKRLHLAKAISVSLYQLQCAGWIHRKLSSYNIVFFADRSTGDIDVALPFICGWQYSRPDDQLYQPFSEYSGRGIGDLDMYVHPARLVSRSSKILFPRFRRSYDIFSLGVVLLEVAFWEPIIVLGSEKDREEMHNFGPSDSGRRARDWRKAFLDITQQEMAAEVGVTYRDVVIRCLEGVIRSARNGAQRGRHEEDNDFEEPGLEKEFFWKVVQPLNGLKMP